MRKNTQGFTLIELLIVIAIIGILAAVLIPNLLDARSRAFDTAAQSCLKEIATAEEVYFIDNNQYDNGATISSGISACSDQINLTVGGTSVAYSYIATHDSGNRTFVVTPAGGVQSTP
ncbi:MAG: prepilin-type N-terminal cleavage/methylation domain-containing protein [Trueperaceae bacterium]|nr:prepilin-type N-terminal cleavage/methylation domain-containing protein [Trueperaceae bacterium]